MELGVRVWLRDVETLDDVGELTAPAPVEPGDLLASDDELYRVEVVRTVSTRNGISDGDATTSG